MAKVRTTLTIDERLLRAVKLRGAQSGRGDSEVIEEVLRREFDFDIFDRLWAKATMSPEEADALALEAQHETRRQAR
jgi:hypothetical protein